LSGGPRHRITREALLSGEIEKLLERHGGFPDKLSPQALEASVQEALAAAPRGDAWVFAYGSLLWNPVIHFAERRVARLRGFHRRFCLWSFVGRGTRERPGLMLGLEPGGSCIGAALRIPRAQVPHELAVLWRREMIAGSYAPRWLPLEIEGLRSPRAGLVFVMNRRHSRYAGKLGEARVARAIGSAVGPIGTCREYFDHTRRSLAELGVADAMLERLRTRMDR